MGRAGEWWEGQGRTRQIPADRGCMGRVPESSNELTLVTPPAAGDFSVNLGLLCLHLICLYLHKKGLTGTRDQNS